MDLVGGFNPTEKQESRLGWWHSQHMEKNVPNHQPVCVHVYIYIYTHNLRDVYWSIYLSYFLGVFSQTSDVSAKECCWRIIIPQQTIK